MKQLQYYGKPDTFAQAIWFDGTAGEDFEIWDAMKSAGWKCWVYLHSTNPSVAGPCHYCVADYEQWVDDCKNL